MALLRGSSKSNIKKTSGLLTAFVVLTSFMGQTYALSVNATEVEASDAASMVSDAEDAELGSESEGGEASSDTDEDIERLSTNYTTISKGYTSSEYEGEDIAYRMEDILGTEYSSYLTTDSHDYTDGSVADVSHSDYIEVTVDVPEDALYEIGFDYLSYDESILPLEIAFTADGSYPFYEARSITLETTWVSEDTA